MAIARSSLVKGGGRVVYDAAGANAILHFRENIVVRWLRNFSDVPASLFGIVDKAETDRRIEISGRLWGAWEGLTTLFPSAALNPTPGTRLCGDADRPLEVHGRDGQKFTFHNAVLTKLANLHLGVDAGIFSADVTFTALLKNNVNPEDANAYVTISAVAFPADSGFAKTNYKQGRYSGAWGAITGFGTITPQNGFDLEFDFRTAPLVVNGLGTVDLTVLGTIARAKCIPIEATQQQIVDAARSQGANSALGRLLSAGSADLTLTGSGVTIVLKAAGLMEHGAVFGAEPLRNGEVGWETTRGFTAGAADAVATVA
jgi:hypothetical protein